MKRSYQYHAVAKNIKNRFADLRKRIPYKKTVVYLQRRPFTSFFVVLGVLLGLIIAGTLLRSFNKTPEQSQNRAKSVETYTIGKAPTVSVQGTVEKFGVVKILAQTSGIVQNVSVKEGDTVGKGQNVVTLSSTYTGANAPALQAQIAQNAYQNVLETYDDNKSLIDTQRQIAEASQDNASQLRDIAQRSIGDTSELLRYSENMLSLTNQAIGNTPSDSQAADFTNPLQASRAQLLATVTQVRAQLRGLEQQADITRAPSQLSDLQKQATLKQLGIQGKALDLQKETARLQAALAGINAQLMTPSTPFNGVVQRVYVRPGQSVNPGTVIALVSQSEHAITAVATIPSEIAAGISLDSASELIIGTKHVRIKPTFVSTDATDGELYSVKYDIPVEYEKDVTDGAAITINVPVSFTDAVASTTFVPLDSVYQTQTDAYVYVIQDGAAKAKQISLGEVFGRFVKVDSGLTKGDTIVLSRNVIEGDKVTTN